MGGVSKSIDAVTRGLNLSPIMQQAAGAIANSGDQRAAFNAILLATTASVERKPNFNLEVEINDLNVRLGNLRGMSSAASASSMRKPLKQFSTQILGTLDAAIRSIADNAK